MAFVYTWLLHWYWLNLNCGPNDIDLSAPPLESQELNEAKVFESFQPPAISPYIPDIIPIDPAPVFPLFHILLMLFGIYPAVNCVWSWRTSQTCWTISLNYFYIFRSAFWGPPTYVWFSWDIKMVPLSSFVVPLAPQQQSLMTFTGGKNYIFFALLLSSHISVCSCIRFV